MTKKIDCISVGDIETNCWLYLLESELTDSGENNSQSCIIIDPGDEAHLILKRLKELNWIPSNIFLTHGHFDHLSALPKLLVELQKTFAGLRPKIGIHRKDAHYLGKNSLAVHQASFASVGGNPAYVETLFNALPEADILFEEGDTAGPFKVLHLPGHTPGSVGFFDEKGDILFSGDTLFNGDWGRTDLPGGSEAQIKQSLRRLLSLKGKIMVLPGHGPASTIEAETGLLKYL